MAEAATVAGDAKCVLVFLPFTGQGIFARNTDKPIETSIIFLIRHSIYGVAMYEGFRWFTI